MFLDPKQHRGQQDWTKPDGSHAEYLPVEASRIARKPGSIDHVRSASVPVVGSTAWQSLFAADGIDPKPGMTILINGTGQPRRAAASLWATRMPL